MKDRMAVQISTQFTKDTNLQLQNCVRHCKLDMSQRHKASMFSLYLLHCSPNLGPLLTKQLYLTSMLIIYTLEPDSLLYFKQFWGIHRVASATVRTLWFQTHKRHFNPGKGTSLSQFSHSQMSHTKLTMDHNFQYVLIRAVHLGCLNHRIEVEVLWAYSREGPYEQHWTAFFIVCIYI